MIDILKAVGVETIYDIGANKGDWSRLMRSKFPLAEIIMFEANPNYNPTLGMSGNYSSFTKVLSHSDGEKVNFYFRNGTGDSYYKEKTKHYDSVAPKKMITSKLDTVIEEKDLPLPDFVKLDTQGSELDVLQGGQKIFETTKVILTELPLIEYNDGAPKMQDYVDFLRSKNFVPVDMVKAHKADNILIQFDILFLKDTYKKSIFGDKNVLV